jgi:hypothetical protein
LLIAIGPAPSFGRPRWTAFAIALKESKKSAHRGISASEAVVGGPSDERFLAIFSALSATAAKTEAGKFAPIRDRNGKSFLSVKEAADGNLTMKIPTDDGAVRTDRQPFAAWLKSRLSSLRDEWLDDR